MPMTVHTESTSARASNARGWSLQKTTALSREGVDSMVGSRDLALKPNVPRMATMISSHHQWNALIQFPKTVLLFMILILASYDLMLATDWKLVGTLSLSSGQVRKELIDLETIVYNKENNTATYWLLGEVTISGMTMKTLVKFISKLDGLKETKTLEYHVYDDEGNEVLRSPEDFVDTLPEYPEDVSLISRAIEMVKEKLEEKK